MFAQHMYELVITNSGTKEGLRYPFMVNPFLSEGREGFRAEVIDLKGCVVEVEKEEDLMPSLKQKIGEWIEKAKTNQSFIPIPSHLDPCSGKLISHISRGLHEKIVLQAKQQGINVNALVVNLLSDGIKNRA